LTILPNSIVVITISHKRCCAQIKTKNHIELVAYITCVKCLWYWQVISFSPIET